LILSHEHSQPPSTAAESGNSQAKTNARANAAVRRSAYLWGAASGVALALFAPVFRPAARSAVKGGIRVGRYTKKLASNVKEEFEDIASEAQADLDREEKTKKRSESSN
jgi:Protein of unknown function (DUF5132)